MKKQILMVVFGLLFITTAFAQRGGTGTMPPPVDTPQARFVPPYMGLDGQADKKSKHEGFDDVLISPELRLKYLESWFKRRAGLCGNISKDKILQTFIFYSVAVPGWAKELEGDLNSCDETLISLRNQFKCMRERADKYQDDPSRRERDLRKVRFYLQDPSFIDGLQKVEKISDQQARDVQYFYYLLLRDGKE